MSFELRDKDLKQYPHFDQLVGRDELIALATTRERVISHNFWPLLSYTKITRKFRRRDADGQKPPPKRRPIRYAARTDAAIFVYYRYLLSELYEARLKELDITDVPTAYRKILKDGQGGGGKCNIDFAHDAFKEVQRQRDCVVVTLDISSYFEHIDDTDGDGFGNVCDADLNNDCVVNVDDLGLLQTVFFGSDANADFNGDGVVNIVDLGLMRTLFFAVPGPSGVSTLCP